MGYITVNQLGDITAVSVTQISGGIAINNDALINSIELAISDYKFLNETIVHIPRPTPYHRWDGAQWVFDNNLVVLARITVTEDIKRYRDSREEGGVRVSINGVYKWFHSDTRSLIKYLFLAFLATVLSSYMTGPIQWKTMDSEQTTPLTIENIVTIVLTVMTLGNTVYGIGRTHINNLQNTNDPYGYNYKTDWPLIYGE